LTSKTRPSQSKRRPPLRFRCTGCGACCIGERDHYVEATPAEQERIQAHLGISRSWFRRRYVVRVDDQTEGICLGDDGRCILLDRDNRCRVYPVRPAQCRGFPLWPELLASKSAWKAAAERCEGIGQGGIIRVKRGGKHRSE